MKLPHFFLSLSFSLCALANLSAYSLLTRPEKPQKLEVHEASPKQEPVLTEPEPIEEDAPSYTIPFIDENMFCEDNQGTDIFQAQYAVIRHEGRDKKRLVLVLKNIARNFLAIGAKPRLSASEEIIDAYIEVNREEQLSNIVRDATLIGRTTCYPYEYWHSERVFLKVCEPFYNYFDNSLSFEIFADSECLNDMILHRVYLLVEQK